MKLQKMCENVRDSEPGTDKHDRACLELAEYLGVSIWVGQYVGDVGDKTNDDFALIILRALEGREEDEEEVKQEHENKLCHSTELKVKF